MMNPRNRTTTNDDYRATPLSPIRLILDDMLARRGAEKEGDGLILGNTFGSAVAEARRAKRMPVQSLLSAINTNGNLDDDLWNEVEQDRWDPAQLGDDVIRSVAETLGIDHDMLATLVFKHHKARQEERKLWSLLTEEAHAFRRQRSRD